MASENVITHAGTWCAVGPLLAANTMDILGVVPESCRDHGWRPNRRNTCRHPSTEAAGAIATIEQTHQLFERQWQRKLSSVMEMALKSKGASV